MWNLEQSLKDMETIRDRNIRIADEAVRLVLECKVPPICSTAGSDHLEQHQKEWMKRLPYTLPPLLDWVELNRHPLLDPTVGVVQKFQKYFVLVFLEQLSCYSTSGLFEINYHDENALALERLVKFNDDVAKILNTNAGIRNWLFHYYGSQLGMHGWQYRPGDLHSLCRLVDFIKDFELYVLFGQRMLSFLEKLGIELLRGKENSDFQKMGIQILSTVMEISFEKQIYSNDAEEILRMTLQLNMRTGDEYGDELWSIIYYSVSSIHYINNSLDDEIMANLLAYLNEQLTRKEEDPNVLFGEGTLAYLKTVTLMLLLDIPEVDVKDCNFDVLTISGRLCDRGRLRRHVKSHLRMNNIRFSIQIRLRVAKLIPKLFAGFTSVYYVDSHAYKCLELLTWMTMFPVSQTKQQKNARGIMLKRLVEEIKRLCQSFIRNPSDFSYDAQDLHELCANLSLLLYVVRDGVKQLPNTGWFRRYRCDMEIHIGGVFLMLELLKCFREEHEDL